MVNGASGANAGPHTLRVGAHHTKDPVMAKNSSHKQSKPVTIENRKDRGSRKAYFLRASGKLPGVVYGLGKEPVAVALPTVETVSVLRSGSHILEATLDGKTEKYLIQDVQ